MHTNRPPIPQLEKVVRQTHVVLEEVLQHGVGPAAIFMKIPEFINDESPTRLYNTPSSPAGPNYNPGSPLAKGL